MHAVGSACEWSALPKMLATSRGWQPAGWAAASACRCACSPRHAGLQGLSSKLKACAAPAACAPVPVCRAQGHAECTRSQGMLGGLTWEALTAPAWAQLPAHVAERAQALPPAPRSARASSQRALFWLLRPPAHQRGLSTRVCRQGRLPSGLLRCKGRSARARAAGGMSACGHGLAGTGDLARPGQAGPPRGTGSARVPHLPRLTPWPHAHLGRPHLLLDLQGALQGGLHLPQAGVDG